MRPFSPGVPTTFAEKSVIPALRLGYDAAFGARVCARLGEIAPASSAGQACDMRGNDGILKKQLADVNTP